MPKVEVHYQGMGGTYRKKTCRLDRLWIRNRRNKQLHTTVFPSVFLEGRPVDVDSWDEVLKIREPDPDLDNTKLVAFYEDDNPFPIPIGPEPSLDEKAQIAGILYEEAHQVNAVIPAARADQMSFIRSLPVTIGAVVVTILIIITGITVVPQVFA